jgi:hypothetical protein
MGSLGGKDLLGVFDIRVGEGHRVGLHLNVGSVAGGYADVAAGILEYRQWRWRESAS